MDLTPIADVSLIVAGIALIALVILAVRSDRKAHKCPIALFTAAALTFGGFGAAINTFALAFI